MYPAFAALMLAAAAPAQAATLEIVNSRTTYGQLGPVRPAGKFTPGDVMFMAFDIKGLSVAEDGRAQYTTQLEVFDKAGKILHNPGPAERIDYIPLGGGQVPAQAYVTIGVDQAPGEYLAKVIVTDKASKATKTLERKFEVDAPAFGLINVFASADERGSTPSPTTGIVGQTVWIHFSAVGFQRDADKKQPNLHFEMMPLDDAGKPTLGKPIVHDVTAADEKLPTYPLRFSLPLTRPGKFSVRLSCTDKMANKTATIDLPVTVLPADK